MAPGVMWTAVQLIWNLPMQVFFFFWVYMCACAHERCRSCSPSAFPGEDSPQTNSLSVCPWEQGRLIEMSFRWALICSSLTVRMPCREVSSFTSAFGLHLAVPSPKIDPFSSQALEPQGWIMPAWLGQWSEYDHTQVPYIWSFMWVYMILIYNIWYNILYICYNTLGSGVAPAVTPSEYNLSLTQLYILQVNISKMVLLKWFVKGGVGFPV